MNKDVQIFLEMLRYSQICSGMVKSVLRRCRAAREFGVGQDPPRISAPVRGRRIYVLTSPHNSYSFLKIYNSYFFSKYMCSRLHIILIFPQKLLMKMRNVLTKLGDNQTAFHSLAINAIVWMQLVFFFIIIAALTGTQKHSLSSNNLKQVRHILYRLFSFVLCTCRSAALNIDLAS